MAATDDRNENVIAYNTADYNSDLIYDTNTKGKISSIILTLSNNANPILNDITI